jgi:hypothetical protein
MKTGWIKIPEKHYVGLVKREGEDFPLAFITPWGKSKGALKRMSSVDDWCHNCPKAQQILGNACLINEPKRGFKLAENIRSTDFGGDKWRLHDPRGFDLEITSRNLAQLLKSSTFENNQIMDQCIWARKGPVNFLLNTNSPEYQQAINEQMESILIIPTRKKMEQIVSRSEL